MAKRNVGKVVRGGSGLVGVVVAAVSVALAPVASAAPDQCSAQALSGTVSSVMGAAGQYLATHPGANDVLTAAYGQQPSTAEVNVRSYFTANPVEYQELRGILSPIGDAQRECNVVVLSPALAAAYDQFMMG